MNTKYVEVKTFDDFNKNQAELINVLNHNMTRLSTDVYWIKKLIMVQLGIFASIGTGLLISLLTS